MTNAIVEKALLIASRTDGPWCPVVNLREIQVEGMNGEDTIELTSRYETLLRIEEDGVHPVNLAEGEVMICRVSGAESRITVRAFGER